MLLFCLNTALWRRECPKRAEARLTFLLKILVDLVLASRRNRLPSDMANSTKFVGFVIQFTVTGA
jgi:hypothetical protein